MKTNDAENRAPLQQIITTLGDKRQPMNKFHLCFAAFLHCWSFIVGFHSPRRRLICDAVSTSNDNGMGSIHLKSTSSDTDTTLTEATMWKMRIVLNERLSRKDEIYSLNGFFQEEDGYEPPQGTFNGVADADSSLKVLKSRWMLSEDPNDRKDSLWIWGLFAEPLYPFLLLQLSLSEEDKDGNKSEWPPLYAQISHRRKDGSVFLEPADLKIRNLEQFNADPFGAAKVEIYEEDVVGRISFQAVS